MEKPKVETTGKPKEPSEKYDVNSEIFSDGSMAGISDISDDELYFS